MAVAYSSDEVVVKEAQRRVQASLPITGEGNQYNPTHAWTVLIGGGGMGASIAAVCREGHDAPSDNIVRDTLNDQGWDDRLIETACNDLLTQRARQCTWQGCFPGAIDLPEAPLYGKLPEDDPEVIRRSEAKEGTTSFHAFATAYVIRLTTLCYAITQVAHWSLSCQTRHVPEESFTFGPSSTLCFQCLAKFSADISLAHHQIRPPVYPTHGKTQVKCLDKAITPLWRHSTDVVQDLHNLGDHDIHQLGTPHVVVIY